MMGIAKSSNIIMIILIIFINLYINITQTTAKQKLYTILLWDFPWLIPALSTEHGSSYFINKKCTFQNCFLTTSHTLFNDVKDYDVILFNSMVLFSLKKPEFRSTTQLYVFFSDEPASMYPVPTSLNGFFDLTWTYKLNSDATWKYMVVKNIEGKVVAPRREVQWVQQFAMKPTSKHIIKKLQTKKIAAAWFVTHCETFSNREAFVKKLISELDAYNLKIDIVGPCKYGNLTCAQNNEECHAFVESDYYFYLAFENSICEDYVTEKVLTATKHYAVPIVYGGADYGRYVIASLKTFVALYLTFNLWNGSAKYQPLGS